MPQKHLIYLSFVLLPHKCIIFLNLGVGFQAEALECTVSIAERHYLLVDFDTCWSYNRFDSSRITFLNHLYAFFRCVFLAWYGYFCSMDVDVT